jgi:hypothetical protein
VEAVEEAAAVVAEGADERIFLVTDSVCFTARVLRSWYLLTHRFNSEGLHICFRSFDTSLVAEQRPTDTLLPTRANS